MRREYGPYTGEIDSVHDGDTVNVVLDIGFDLWIHTRVRIYGINTPELSSPAGKAAREFAQSLLKPGDKVKVISLGWDKFGGRIDGKILFGNGEDYAERMKAAGHAKFWLGQGTKPV
jgi:endonuclease YncB( thermonuclease family)